MDSNGSGRVGGDLQIGQRWRTKRTQPAAPTEMPKFGDQSSISRDEPASATLTMAADCSSLQPTCPILEPSKKKSPVHGPSISISASK